MQDEYDGESLVFGGLLNLYGTRMQITLTEASGLHENLRRLERDLFMGFVSFVLARAGFNLKTFIEWEGWLTTEFKFEDWVEEIDHILYTAEELKGLSEEMEDLMSEGIYEWITWSNCYVNESNKMIKVIFFAREHPFWLFAQHDDRLLITRDVDELLENYLIVHPTTYKQAIEKFRHKYDELKENLIKQNTYLLSTDDFISKFIPDEQKRYLVKENWINLRKGILEKSLKKWPMLLYVIQVEKLVRMGEFIEAADLRCKEQDFDSVIKNIASVCKLCLQLLYQRHKGEEPDPTLELYDLRHLLEEVVKKEFDIVTIDDLSFISSWENKPNPSSDIAFDAMQKGKRFYEHFKRMITEQSSATEPQISFLTQVSEIICRENIEVGQKNLARTTIKKYLQLFNGNVFGILNYIDETTFGYLDLIPKSCKIKIITSRIDGNEKQIRKSAKTLEKSLKDRDLEIKIIDLQAAEKYGGKMHQRWLACNGITRIDKKETRGLLIDLGTDLKDGSISNTCHKILVYSNPSDDLRQFEEYWERTSEDWKRLTGTSIESKLFYPSR